MQSSTVQHTSRKYGMTRLKLIFKCNSSTWLDIQNTFPLEIICHKKNLNNLRNIKSDISTVSPEPQTDGNLLQAEAVQCQEYLTVKPGLVNELILPRQKDEATK